MINLLAYKKKDEIKIGKQNVMLLKFLIISVAAVVLVLLLTIGSFAVLRTSRDQATERAEVNQKKIDEYSSKKTEIDTYTANLGVAKTILDEEVDYVKIFLAIGAALPENVIIQQLDVKPENFENGLTMQVYSRTQSSMVSVKDNMQKVPEIFKKVQFSSIDFTQCKDKPGVPLEELPYACEATLNVVFNEKVKGIQ